MSKMEGRFIELVRMGSECPVFMGELIYRDTRDCYEGCHSVNPHFAGLCDRFEDYRDDCLTNRKSRNLGGEE